MVETYPKILDEIYIVKGSKSKISRNRPVKGNCYYCGELTSHQKNFLQSNFDLSSEYVCIECSIEHKSDFY